MCMAVDPKLGKNERWLASTDAPDLLFSELELMAILPLTPSRKHETQRSIRVVLIVGLAVAFAHATQLFAAPGTGSDWNVVPMPGQTEFIFASGAPPEDVAGMNAHLDWIAANNFGNGLDVFLGPASYTVPQYQSVANRGLYSVQWHNTAFPGIYSPNRPGFTAAEWGYLAILDKPNAPAAVHFGEWDYTFHHLLGNSRNGWGPNPPTTKVEAYTRLKAYYQERNATYQGRLYSVLGHSQYEPYSAEWGTIGIGLELGENIKFSQLKMAMARGASRQWDIPWSMQFSAWFAGSLTTTGPLTGGPYNARGADAGHSRNLFERMWYHSWFAGAGMVTTEGGGFYLFEEGGAAPYTLTTLGRIAKNFNQFATSHDRGVPYTPLAVVLDKYAGYNAFDDLPWGILPKTAGDQQLHDLFQRQLFPGSAASNAPEVANPEAPYLVNTPYGEMSDVLLSTVTASKLSKYPEVLLAGDMTFDAAWVNELELTLRAGSRLLLSQAHATALGTTNLSRLQTAGRVEILAPWLNLSTGRLAAISNDRLAQIAAEHLPIGVSGVTVEYQINRNDEGWVIELINNRGVTKKGHLPAEIDVTVASTVTMTPRVDVLYVYNWKTGAVLLPAGSTWSMTLGPGAIQYLQFVTPLDADFNLDGYVDDADWEVWHAGLGMSSGATRASGDADQDGDVDGFDFLTWQRLRGQFIPIPAAVPVPEPAAACLAMASIALLGAARQV